MMTLRMSDLLTPREAAELHGVTASRIRRLATRRQIAAIKFGGKWIVHRRSVRRVLGKPIRPIGRFSPVRTR